MKKIIVHLSFLALICCALFSTSCMLNQSNLAGRINGSPISASSYMDSYRAHYQNFQILNNRVPDNEENALIKRQTWINATRHVILMSYFKKYNIRVSPQEAIDSLRLNIPEYVLTSPNFQTKGVFDQSIYLQSLLYDTPQNLQPLRKHYQEYLIPILKLKKFLIDKELFTSAEKKLGTKALGSTADIEWTILDVNSIEPVVTDEEIQFYYANNSAKYQLDPYYSLAYTTLKVAPSEEDKLSSSALADSIYAELRQGIPATQIKDKYAPAHPQLSFKNAGFIRNNDLQPELYSFLISLEPGAFSRPVQNESGYTIYQLEQLTKSMSSFNTFTVPYVPSQTSIDLLFPNAQRVYQLASSIKLAETTAEMDLALAFSSKIAPKGAWLDDAKTVQNIYNQIQGQKAGFIANPVYSDDLQSWIIVELQDNQLNSVKQLKDVRELIRAQLAADKRTSMAMYMANQISAGQASPPPSAEVIRIKDMQAASKLKDFDLENTFYQVLHQHWKGDKLKVHAIKNYILIPRIYSVTTAKSNTVSQDEVKRLFAANLPANWFDAWMDTKIKQADLKIFTK